MSSSPTDTRVVEVTMPQMGVSVVEGTITAWHKRTGDWVQADEVIAEVSTDKIDTELPAPVRGRVAEILVEVDETVGVGAVLARISTDAVAGEAHPDEQNGGQVAGGAVGALTAPPAREGASARPALPGRAARHSPVVLRIAQREGIDLALVTGTGRGGRVRKADVLAHLAQRDAPELAPAPLHTESPYREDVHDAVSPPALTGAGAAAPAGAAGGEGDVSEPLSRMRRAIAEHMVRSLHTAAHCTSIVEADMSGIETARARLGLRYLPLVARCVIDALREHPQLNATLEGQTLTRHRDINLGIAVSLGDAGLIVPVLHRAQRLSPEGLGEGIADLAHRARSGALAPDEVRGATFTITNPGGFGTIASTPIISQPQVAILDLEAVVKRAVVVSDESGHDSIAIRPMTNLCLSWDHRALDGALAAAFLGAVRAHIESCR